MHRQRTRATLTACAMSVVIATILPAVPVRSQSPPFEVASITINRSGEDRVSGGFQPAGRFSVRNYALRSLIAAAYLRPQINPDFLIAGGPKWIDSTRFDVDARSTQDWPAGADGPS